MKSKHVFYNKYLSLLMFISKTSTLTEDFVNLQNSLSPLKNKKDRLRQESRRYGHRRHTQSVSSGSLTDSTHQRVSTGSPSSLRGPVSLFT